MFGRNQDDDKFFSDKKEDQKQEEKKIDTEKASVPPARAIPSAPPKRLSDSAPRPEMSPIRTETSGPARTSVSYGDQKVLQISPGISVSGEIKHCDRIVVEGEADVSLEGTKALEISQTGTFRGDTEVEEADIAGKYIGTLTVTGRLIVRKTGLLEGNIRYKELIVETGAIVSGEINCMVDKSDS